MKDLKSPVLYRIRVQGHIDATWADWFEGLQVEHTPEGTSTLLVALADQSALIALLQRLHYLCVTILSVSIVEHK